MAKAKSRAPRAPKYSPEVLATRQRARVAYRQRRTLFKVYLDEPLARAVDAAKRRAGVETNIDLLRALLP